MRVLILNRVVLDDIKSLENSLQFFFNIALDLIGDVLDLAIKKFEVEVSRGHDLGEEEEFLSEFVSE